MIKIDLNNFSIANNLPFVLIAGPCVIENEEHTLMMAEEINNICSELKINFIFKSSFDKANRSSIKSNRGVPLDNALKIFQKIKAEINCPIIRNRTGPNTFFLTIANNSMKSKLSKIYKQYSDYNSKTELIEL